MLKSTLTLLLLSITILSGTMFAQSIPFQSAQGLIFIDAQVNGQRVSLIVDTGASSSLISYRIAGFGKYKLPKMKNASTTGGDGFSGQAFEIKADFTLANVTVKDLSVFAGNVDTLSERTGRKCDGLIGQDLLRRFKSVKIDYSKHIIEFEP